MIPPTPASPIDLGSLTDEKIILMLKDMNEGKPPPTNVIADINPYKYRPSNLPDGIAYLIVPDVIKDSELGSWRAKGEPYQIFISPAISGCRTTLEFYEGQGPDERRTDWIMQEYKITLKGLYSSNKTKDFGSLCRLIQIDEHIPENLLCLTHGGALSEANSNSGKGSIYKGQKKTEDETKSLTAAGTRDCLLKGDYLELDDLIDAKSPYYSTDNSSCPSFSSDELFDASSLLRDLDDKNIRDESFKYTFCASAKPNEVVMLPGTIGKLSAEETYKPVTKKDIEVASGHQNAAASSSHPKANKENEKKAASEGTKKLMKRYFCLMPF